MPYVARFANEVPFAHTLAITRFLGGYTQAAATLFCATVPGGSALESYCTPGINPWSLDYVISSGGSFSYQSQLMLGRISPYVGAGYAPGDMTLVLINVPWAMASSAGPQNGSACTLQTTGGSLGIWGQCNPPANTSQWGSAISQLAADLLGVYPSGAADFRYEIGDEYDQSSTFNGQSSDFYALYENAYQSVRTALPSASVAAGDFSGSCYDSAATGASGCVYDSQAFYSREKGNGSLPAYVARSLNSFWDTNPTPYPSKAAALAATSFAYVGAPAGTPLEIHQFGLLNQPWGAAGTQVSSIQANWEFQALMGLKQNLPGLARVYNWGGFATVRGAGAISFLEGAGYVRMILDNHQGAELYRLPVTSPALPAGNELMAVAIVEGNGFQIVLSNTDVVAVNANLALMQPDPPVPLSITLPAAWPAVSGWSYLRYSQAAVDNVFAQAKSDLANASPAILDPDFAACAGASRIR